MQTWVSGLSLDQEELCLRLPGGDYRLRSNSKVLIHELKNYYQQFLTNTPDKIVSELVAIQGESPELKEVAFVRREPELNKALKEEWCDFDDGRLVRKSRTGLIMGMSGDKNVVIGDCEANPNQVTNFINNRFIEKQLNDGGVLLHASAVLRGNIGLAICGFSGAGKSTLALHLMENSEEWDFLSNDRIVLKEAHQMLGVPKHPRVNPGTILTNEKLVSILKPERRAQLLDMPKDELWTLEEKYDAIIEDVFGEGRYRLSASLTHLFVLNWHFKNQDTAQINEVNLREREDLFPAFMKSEGLFFRPGENYKQKGIAEYSQALEKVRVFEATGKVDFSKLVEFANKL